MNPQGEVLQTIRWDQVDETRELLTRLGALHASGVAVEGRGRADGHLRGLWMWPCSGAGLLDGSQPAIPPGCPAGRHRQACRTGGLGRRLTSSGVGGLRLEVQINSGTGRVRIQDESISSQSGSIVLVDEVDGPAGPRIVETLRVEPRFSGGFVDIDIVVRRHPALVPFLRCDARFPDQPQHSPIEVAMWRQMTDLTCARLRDAR